MKEVRSVREGPVGMNEQGFDQNAQVGKVLNKLLDARLELRLVQRCQP